MRDGAVMRRPINVIREEWMVRLGAFLLRRYPWIRRYVGNRRSGRDRRVRVRVPSTVYVAPAGTPFPAIDEEVPDPWLQIEAPIERRSGEDRRRR